MKNSKNLSMVILSILLMVSLVVGLSVVPATADDTIVYNFAESKWDWWGAVQGTVNGTWGQNSQAIDRHYDNGKLTYDADSCVEDGNGFQQLQDKWQKLPAGNLYFDFKNNTAVSVTVKFATGSASLFETSVSANSTKKISFTNSAESNFSIFIMNWNTVIPSGDGLFELGPIYKVDDGGTTVATTTSANEANILYKFTAANYNWGKTEGWNGSTSQWGTFTGYDITHLENGGASYNTSADAMSVFRQFNSNWKNVPAVTNNAYIDITNNANRKIRVKIVVNGYTTPADSNLPTVDVGATETIKLGKLTGGSMQIMIQDFENSDKLNVGEGIFTISALYKIPGEPEETTVPTTKATSAQLIDFDNITITPVKIGDIAANNAPTDANTISTGKWLKVYAGTSTRVSDFTTGYVSLDIASYVATNANSISFKAISVPDAANGYAVAHYGLTIDGTNYWSGIDTNGVIGTVAVIVNVVGQTLYDTNGNSKVITAADIPNVTKFLIKPTATAIKTFVDDISIDVGTVVPTSATEPSEETTTLPEITTTLPVTTTTVPTGIIVPTAPSVDPTTAPTTAINPTQPTTKKPVPAVLMNTKAKAKLKLTPYKKALKIKISKTVKNANGYQISVSKNKKFKKATVKLTAKKTLKITKLKKSTKYYVRVRPYQNVNGKRVFGAWSKVYTKKTK